MGRFRYKAVNDTGEVVEGHLEALDQDAAIQQLRGRGFLPIKAEEDAASRLSDLLSKDILGGRTMSRHDVADTTREIATLLQAGIEVDRALEIVESLSRKPAVRTVLGRVLADIRGGSSLTDALGKQEGCFPRYYVSMVRAGEVGGALTEVYERLADYLEQSIEARQRISAALIYPTILLATAGLSILVLITLVLPEFRPLFESAGSKLPALTRIVLMVSDFLRDYWWALIVGGLVCAVVAQRALQAPGMRLKFDEAVIRWPIFGPMVLNLEVARLARILGTLLQNGVSVVPALEIVETTSRNQAIQSELVSVRNAVKQGRGLSDTLGASPILPDKAAQLLKVGDETGRMEAMLMRIADTYDNEVARGIQRALALLTPVLTVVLGLLVAGIVSSMFMAILSINEAVF